MPVGNSWKYRPERQARLQRDMADPEWVRRREMYYKARGPKKDRIAGWNVSWNTCGRHKDFPDFPEWDSFSDKQKGMLNQVGRRGPEAFERQLEAIREEIKG